MIPILLLRPLSSKGACISTLVSSLLVAQWNNLKKLNLTSRNRIESALPRALLALDHLDGNVGLRRTPRRRAS